MGRLSAFLPVLALAAVLTTALPGCGNDSPELLPGGTAAEITANLDLVGELAGAGDCVGAAAAAQAVSEQIDALGGVDGKLKTALREGATRLNEVVANCEEAAAEETTPAVEPAEELEEPKEKEKAAKPGKEKDEATEAPVEPETQSLPPQAKGKAKGQEKAEEAPPEEAEAPSGGVGPGEPAEGE